MLSRDLRLRERSAFHRVYAEGRSWGHPLLILHTLPQPEGARRVGFSVSRKVGGAVERNRVRRRLREAVRALVPRLRRGADFVFVARNDSRQATFDELSGALAELLSRAGALISIEGDDAPYQWPERGGRSAAERSRSPRGGGKR